MVSHHRQTACIVVVHSTYHHSYDVRLLKKGVFSFACAVVALPYDATFAPLLINAGWVASPLLWLQPRTIYFYV